jgi:hypothetical protein
VGEGAGLFRGGPVLDRYELGFVPPRSGRLPGGAGRPYPRRWAISRMVSQRGLARMVRKRDGLLARAGRRARPAQGLIRPKLALQRWGRNGRWLRHSSKQGRSARDDGRFGLSIRSARSAPARRLDRCAFCRVHPDRRRCTYCTKRRHRAGELADQEWSVEEIADELGITEPWAARLVAQAYQLRELETLRCDEIPVKTVLEAFARWQRRAPEFNTWAELATRMGYSRADTLRRRLGLVARDGRRRETVSVELAGRLMVQMGYTPAEFDWL